MRYPVGHGINSLKSFKSLKRFKRLVGGGDGLFAPCHLQQLSTQLGFHWESRRRKIHPNIQTADLLETKKEENAKDFQIKKSPVLWFSPNPTLFRLFLA